ncbi:Rrf2 family transcriptional regulator [Roseomonas alkaliterrae]|uniref:Rrf2 family iron-sulfur cluster assembly transcriptional regulator n=1 Tax=Neoroseomonas alkaliterrae TaxID=1452450 RepID=A0A840Y852_9PROT|nr:Rrf2 family transcriptional regulator [Neoroseomonas alkaliterrae]MBB5690044.1 Rrf2 family iron-sulfur cluster assembly transcriptional regulator [Neoroseomonas alkaliterrae]MBR0676368.1 Rrf2 family transcriptional regulator [Neoroseomonas alkaliterrae]
MRLSTRGRYAVMAMVEMAAREGRNEACQQGRPVTLNEIAAAQHLSVAYLEQLFGRLRRAGLVASARGPGGGYRLARPAAEIPIAAVVEAADEPIIATRCEDGGPGCLAGDRCLTHDLWAELGDQIRLFLGGMTLADVVERRVTGRARPPAPAEGARPAAE